MADRQHKVAERNVRGARQVERPSVDARARASAETGVSPSPAYTPMQSSTLLGDSRLNARGNQLLKASIMAEMQQAYGNRAVQRFLRHSLDVQRQGPAERQAELAAQINDPLGTFDSCKPSDSPSIQRQAPTGPGKPMRQSIIEVEAVKAVRDQGWKLPELKREVLHRHWSSPQERRAYTQRFIIAYWERHMGGQPDVLEIDHLMLQHEKLVLSKMTKAQVDKELESAPEWMKEGLKTSGEKQQEQQKRQEERDTWVEGEKKREEQEKQALEAKQIQELEQELERLEKEEQQKFLEQQKRPMRPDLRNYPYYTYRPSISVALGMYATSAGIQKLNDAIGIPIIPDPLGAIINISEGIVGVSITGTELKTWERVLKFVSGALAVVPGASNILAAPLKVAARGIFTIAKAAGKKSKDILQLLRGASKLSAEQRKLLKEAEVVLSKGGTLSQKHLNAITDASATLKAGQATSAGRVTLKAGKAGSGAVAEAEKEAAKKGAKAGEKAEEGVGKKAGDAGKACKACQNIDDAIPPLVPASGGLVRITKAGKLLFCNSPCDGARKSIDKLKTDLKNDLSATTLSNADRNAIKRLNKDVAPIESSLEKLEKEAIAKVGDKKALADIEKKAGRLKDAATNLDHRRLRIIDATAAFAKSVLKKTQLPTTGRIRYVPPDGWKPSMPLPRGPGNGYVDKWGNEWVRGPSRTKGEAFEWDVQLSNAGKSKIGWLAPDPKMTHVNVSLKGEVTH